ncbi:PAS domain S-box protein [Roseomonas sp. 18066]|uniref:PAS domain S-box protein n=1 Tax=Roseomonas sp. 18066 TaxID=2681412 RepID=UPI0013571FFF|nr:PAS domain S-box protein [Roseomonas sp. 18066]
MDRAEIDGLRRREQALLAELARLRAEAEHEPSAALLAALAALEKTATPIVLTDPAQPDDPIVFANRAFQELTGYPAAELLGRNCRLLQDPETDPAELARLRAALAEGREVAVELVNRRRDGSRFRNALLVSPVRDQRGRLLYHFGTQRDLSAEDDTAALSVARLAASEARWHALLAAVDTGFCIVEMRFGAGGRATDYRFLEVNPAFERQTGLTGATGRWMREIAPDHEQVWFDRYAEVARSGRPMRFEHEAAALGRWFEVQAFRLQAGAAPEVGILFSDITVRRQAEAELRSREARWRSVFEGLQEGLILGEALRDAGGRVTDWRYLDVNPAWCAMTGRSAAEARGSRLLALFPSIETGWVEDVASALDSGGIVTFQRTVDMLGRWYEGKVQPIGGDRFTVIFTEVTAAREAERRRAALAELDALLREGGAPAAMVAEGARLLGQALRADRAGYGTLAADGRGFSVGADWNAAGMPSLVGSYSMDVFGDYVRSLLAGEAVAVDDVATDPRTASIAAMLQGAGIRALLNLPVVEAGRLVALLFVNQAAPRAWTPEETAFAAELAQRLRQAVERRRAEEELRALAASLERQVAERAQALADAQDFSRLALSAVQGVGVWTFDVASDRFTADAAVADLYGLDPAEAAAGILRARFLANVHPEDRARLRAVMAGGLQHGGDLELEYRLCHPDGRVRWVLSRGHTYFSADGQPLRRTGVGVETTRQHELEDQLRQSSKMEAVGQLTGGIAHDFNNLLTGITGSLELLTRRLAQGRHAEIPRYADAARGAAQRAAALTHRLLAFSRRQTLDPRPTDANRLVAGMEELIRRTIGPSIALQITATPGVWTVLVDPPQLENALLNLCINARDAMPQGGRLEIATDNHRLDAEAAAASGLLAGDYVTLCVGDTGSGMTPDVIARAFDPFFTTKPQGQGTGLGLSMIYGFVRQSGGAVRIASTPGEGSRLCLDLPRHDGPAVTEPLPPAAVAVPRGQGERVLVVDDEPSVRLLVTEVLEDLGYAALEAADGPAGLRILRSPARIDLLVTDVGLPQGMPGGMNGRQLAEAARRLRPGLRILFITGFAESAVLSHGDLGPGMQLLTKPFSLEALAARLRGLLAGS